MSTTEKLTFYLFPEENRGFAPTKATRHDAGYDLKSAVDVIIPAGKHTLVQTNVGAVIPTSYYGRVAPRSGLAYKRAIDVMAGVIDSAYRGKIGVILVNHGQTDFSVKRGDRIAQLIITKIMSCETVHVKFDEAPPDNTDRGSGGFGSTGQ